MRTEDFIRVKQNHEEGLQPKNTREEIRRKKHGRALPRTIVAVVSFLPVVAYRKPRRDMTVSSIKQVGLQTNMTLKMILKLFQNYLQLSLPTLRGR